MRFRARKIHTLQSALHRMDRLAAKLITKEASR